MLYPITFKPVLKNLIWGGENICLFKNIDPVRQGIGESWEVSHLPENYSVVVNGPLAGKSINELMLEYGEKLVGKKILKHFGQTFPLLIKFIDAKENLSIQIHPDDELAEKRHQAWGKTEMWYVIDADPEAKLHIGFSKPVTPDEYMQRAADSTLMEVLKSYTVKAGDVFYIPAGTIHTVGPGCFLVEIQQTSNITYRIYDYDRRDANGNRRELHTELAKDAIDYTYLPDHQTHYEAVNNSSIQLVKSTYFTTNLLNIDSRMVLDYQDADRFHCYICLAGEALLKDNAGNELLIRQGMTVLIPAETNYLEIIPSSQTKLLETFIDIA